MAHVPASIAAEEPPPVIDLTFFEAALSELRSMQSISGLPFDPRAVADRLAAWLDTQRPAPILVPAPTPAPPAAVTPPVETTPPVTVTPPAVVTPPVAATPPAPTPDPAPAAPTSPAPQPSTPVSPPLVDTTPVQPVAPPAPEPATPPLATTPPITTPPPAGDSSDSTPAATPAPKENAVPVIAGSPASSASLGQAWSFTPAARDADGDALVFTAQNVPAWASFDPTTGTISGTPSAAGTFSGITVAVSDGKASASLAPFTVVVASANRAPTIRGTPPSRVQPGQVVEFYPQAADADGDPLFWYAVNAPQWLRFDASLGVLSGIAPESGTFENIVIGVSDGKARAALPAFTITVATQANAAAAPANAAPMISGVPVPMATVGQLWSFIPTTWDPNGDTLTFSVTGKPAWASFDSRTGMLSGIPPAEGTTDDIVIRVSDGKATVAMPAFSITASVQAQGSVTLSWAAPTTNTDGSPLANLAGYKILYGTSPGSYTQTLTIPSAVITSAVIENLPPGHTYYFAVKSYTNASVESQVSAAVSKSL